jgi:hypothetical protein
MLINLIIYLYDAIKNGEWSRASVSDGAEVRFIV